MKRHNKERNSLLSANDSASLVDIYADNVSG